MPLLGSTTTSGSVAGMFRAATTAGMVALAWGLVMTAVG